jgi:hypothetical protein
LSKEDEFDKTYNREIDPQMREIEALQLKMGSRYPEALFIAPVTVSDKERDRAWRIMKASL